MSVTFIQIFAVRLKRRTRDAKRAILAAINTDIGVDMRSQRQALVDLFKQAGGGNGGAGAVIYRLADDNVQTNPINKRAFIDAEYNRTFVSQYVGYLRRNP